MRKMRTWLNALGMTICLCPLLLAAKSGAAVDTWQNSAGGIFLLGANWSANAPPGSQDLAFFNLPATYSVSFVANQTNDQLWVDQGQLTFDLGGHTYQLNENYATQPVEGVVIGQTYGNTAALTLANGTFQAQAVSIAIAHQQTMGGDGTLTVGAGATLNAVNSSKTNTIEVGNDATGTLVVQKGGHINVDSLNVATGLSSGTTSVGNVTVTGPGSSIASTLNIQLGAHPGGAASFLVTEGGSLTGHTMYVGFSQQSTANSIVEGSGSYLSVTTLSVGTFGTGSLIIRDGATVSLVPDFLPFGTLLIGSNNGGNGTVTVSGNGTKLSMAADLAIGVVAPLNKGDKSSASFRVVGGGATINVGGKLQMGVSAPSLGALIDSSGLSPINIAGSAMLQGQMNVELLNFTPSRGQKFTVLAANGGISGSLSLTGPDASEFSLASDGTHLSLTYIAQPGDLTADGKVNFADLVLLAQHYGHAGTFADGDCTHDGKVDFADLVVIAQNYGAGSMASPLSDEAFEGDVSRAFGQAGASLPEPSLSIGVLGLICGRLLGARTRSQRASR